jgi:uncharacterized protein YdhG (YjbR/CyaY superfamily)
MAGHVDLKGPRKEGGVMAVITADLIAPCGMNCALCLAYQRDKNSCRGCRADDVGKPNSCRACIIKNCPAIQQHQSGFCYECDKYPCRRLKDLDKRYRAKYEMSMLENLEDIRRDGLEDFLRGEEKRWECKACGALVCVHRDVCLACKTPYRDVAQQSIDDYIGQFPPEVQELLRTLRGVIAEAAPLATEKFSYQMPTFYLHGNLVHFAAFKKHIGFYPTPSGIEAFKQELAAYKGAKGSVQFPFTEPLPYDLISRIVKFRVEENSKRAESKGKKR